MSKENVVAFTPVVVGEGYRFDADEILDAAKGYEFERVVILGRLENGELYVAGSANAGESLILIEQAKHHIVFGDSE